MTQQIYITECPRDAMQGLHNFIPTQEKIDYLNRLLRVGFYRLDFGSFVSPKAIPQLQDTATVLKGLTEDTNTELLAIVANLRGVRDALSHERVDIVGFPFSISETFQLRNTNSTRDQSLETVKEMVELCAEKGKTPLVYLSMGFGNPYGDEWSEHIVTQYAERLYGQGVREFALADTMGSSSPEKIRLLYPYLTQALPNARWGLHLHSHPRDTMEKIQAAIDVGCTRFDTAILGLGGCPMADDELVGNIATEQLLTVLQANRETQSEAFNHGLDEKAWVEALDHARVFFAGRN